MVGAPPASLEAWVQRPALVVVLLLLLLVLLLRGPSLLGSLSGHSRELSLLSDSRSTNHQSGGEVVRLGFFFFCFFFFCCC